MSTPSSPPPEGPPPGWVDPRAQQGPPPPPIFWDGDRWRQTPPPPQYGFQPPPPQYGFPQQQPQQPGPHPTQWWHDGHKWRPPVGAQPSRAALLAQVPGMLIKLIFLGLLLWLILAFLGVVH